MEPAVTISMSSLAPDHLDSFVRALTGLLSTDRADFVFAQIVDGLPAKDIVGHQPAWNVEIRDNPSPSQEAIAVAKRFRESLDVRSVQLEANKVQRYQNAIPRSTEFSLRLLELLAMACHDLAAFIYTNTQPGIREDVQDPERQAALLKNRQTNFMLAEYMDWQQYPKGVADMVGYWAEYHLFGGVILFDRGDSGTECKSVYLHPVGGYMIFQLSDAQIGQFTEYIKQETNRGIDTPSPFPFKAERWAQRVEPFDAMSLNIYRDKYERIIPKERPRSCIRRAEDDPHYQDHVEFIREIYRQRDAQKNAPS